MKFTANTITGLDWAAKVQSYGSYVHFETAVLLPFARTILQTKLFYLTALFTTKHFMITTYHNITYSFHIVFFLDILIENKTK